jgi:hypothetical protein
MRKFVLAAITVTTIAISAGATPARASSFCFSDGGQGTYAPNHIYYYNGRAIGRWSGSPGKGVAIIRRIDGSIMRRDTYYHQGSEWYLINQQGGRYGVRACD